MTFQVIEGDIVVRDQEGNPVGVVLDGSVYRLAVDAKAQVTGTDGSVADVNTEGTRTALAVEYPEMMAMLGRISLQLHKLIEHISIITDEEPGDPLA